MDLEKNREIDRNRYTISKSRKIFEFSETKSTDTDIQDGNLEKSRRDIGSCCTLPKMMVYFYKLLFFINFYPILIV